MKSTIRDVARAAGVSAMAVSKVLHGTGQNVRVSKQTAEKIRDAAAELKYQPNAFARNLKAGKTNTVGVVLQHFSGFVEGNPYFPQLFNGIVSALFPANYTLALCPKLVQDGDMGAMLDGRFDGVLWARPDFTEANVETLRHAHVPLVMLHAPPGSAEGISTFCADNPHALQTAVDHLIDLGHASCTFVNNLVDSHTAEGRSRSEAFLAAVQARGIHGELFEWDETPSSLEDWIRKSSSITNIICFSDTLAGRVLTACQSFGLRVPDDISVVGFDSSTFCDLTTPKLTSVFQPVEKIAFEATTHLLKLIELQEKGVQGFTHSPTLYSCGLDVRESTARPSPKKRTHEN